MFFYKEYISLIKVGFLSNLPHFEVETVLAKDNYLFSKLHELMGSQKCLKITIEN